MSKQFIFIISFLFFSLSSYSSETVFCDGNCNNKCMNNKLSLGMIQLESDEIIKKFALQENATREGKTFLDGISKSLSALAEKRKSILSDCLDFYCEQTGKKETRIEIGKGLFLSTTNPLCDYTPQNRETPISLLTILLQKENESFAQISFKANDGSLRMMIKTPTQNCTENEGGTFNNTIVVGLESLSVAPDDSTTEVNNTPVGAQIIRKKKVIPSFKLENNLLNFNLGDGYEANVDIASNKMISNNLLRSPCKGSVIRNSAKKTSRIAISPSAVNSKGTKVYDSNNYKIIESEKAKVNW